MAKLLLVDDDWSLCEFVSDALKLDGHVVEISHDGDDALTRLSVSASTGNLLKVGTLTLDPIKHQVEKDGAAIHLPGCCGRQTQNNEPSPSLLVTPILPPCCSTRALAIGRDAGSLIFDGKFNGVVLRFAC